jgi:beta-galactosidase
MSRNFLLAISLFSATISGVHGQNQSKIEYPVPVLTPIPMTVGGVDNPRILLNGEWDFKIQQQNSHTGSAIDGNIAKPPVNINVPGEWEMQGLIVQEGETAVYSRNLVIPADWKGKRIKIRFDAVSSHALVKINGKVVGEHEGSFVPFEVDVTDAINYGNDQLVVEVQSLTISDRLACTSQYACHTVGGIMRKVTLFATSAVHLSGHFVHTVFDSRYKDANLIIRSELINNTNLPARAKLIHTLSDNTGTVVARGSSQASMLATTGIIFPVETNLPVRAPKQWNPEHPNLYLLKTEVLVEGKIVQVIEQKHGFRQIEIRENQFLVNGNPIKLHGVNRHSVHPLTGRSISPELERRDAELFREANCNFIRTSHYPPSEEFLTAADELGLFVESEASLCWIQHHASPIWRLWNYLDDKYLPYMIRANQDNILSGRNHPSVIIWSLGNESRWSPLWERVNQEVKQLDPTRPTAFHDQCWGGFNNAGSKADLANYHYPGINGPRAADTSDRPVLFGEYAHLSTYNRRELLTDPGVRSAYNAPLVKFYDSIYYYDGNLGGAIWSGIDDIFHIPGGRIVGYGPWGPLDGWRRPKPEYWGMKKAYSPIRITNADFTNVSSGYLELSVENRYDFTSFKEIKIEVKNGGTSKFIQSDIPAREKGLIRIPVQPDTPEVFITFTDPRGFLACEEKYKLLKPIPKPHREVSLSSSENESAIFIRQGEIEYSISKTTGIITGARKNDALVLTRGPVFSVIPMNSDNGGKPNVAGETYQNDITPLKNYPLYTLFSSGFKTRKTDAGISISMEVTYTDGKGKQSYLFTPEGLLITEYEVEYIGIDSIPYQYGLMLELPASMDQLSWQRDGDFTVYPVSDIARNEGTAKLNSGHLKAVEEFGVVPAGEWKDDANDLGSNDFRSTKHSIREASLTDGKENWVRVYSDGNQSSRTWMQDSHIHWLIADYWNNGSEPFYGSPHSDGRISIKNKVLKGKLVLKLE